MQFCRNVYTDNHIEGLVELGRDGAIGFPELPPRSAMRGWQERLESMPVLPSSRIDAVLRQTAKRLIADEGNTAAELADAPPRTRAESGPYDDLAYDLAEAALRTRERRGWPVIGTSTQIPEGERRRWRAARSRTGRG